MYLGIYDMNHKKLILGPWFINRGTIENRNL